MRKSASCFRQFALCAALGVALSGCAAKPADKEQPAVMLPPAEVSFVAPVGDAALEYTQDVALCLPRHDGMQLATVVRQVTFSPTRPYAESVVRSLLNFTGDNDIRSLGGDVKLTLYGTSPVEVSRDVVTVNLGASALQLDRKDFYLACQAITNTLTGLDAGIQHVNVLVAGKAVGLDIGNSLPMGSLGENSSQDLAAVYSQLLSRRVSGDDTALDQSLSLVMTLYFPLTSCNGLLAEARSVSFANQSLGDMVTVVLRELAAGPAEAEIVSPALPLLGDLLTATPTLLELSDGGGQVLKLSFAHNLDDMLEAYGLSRQQSMASLCYTLCTFFPNLSGIQVSVDGVVVDPLLLTEDSEEASVSSSQNNVFLRANFENRLFQLISLYLANEDQTALCRVERPIPSYQSSSPRVLLHQLALGPQPSDSLQGLSPLMPEGAITDTTVLGLSISDGTLLVNFAPAFSEIGRGLSAESERLLAYGMVNTLCTGISVNSVCFFQSGAQFDGFGGNLYWRGLFYPLPGM